ncbi:MAG: relaxase/mobilization nuclease domain-containing protein [Christiangramia sp.]|nr:mobilization protein [Christiangramia sp.]|tara:strand:+ start:97 stop:960 length:864 start_codon:yes stop_codon:yes gene_type:complete
MIGKGKAISHTRASMSYGWNQEKDAQVIFKQELIGDTPEEITKEFKAIQDLNYNCEKNTISFVLSPTIEDGQKLNNKQLKNICKSFMEKMQLADRQAIAFVHQDKQHKHIHLYVNRIDYQGKAYNDSFIGKHCQQIAEKVAKEFKLTTVKDVQEERLINLKDIRSEIKRRHDIALRVFKPDDLIKYMEAMKANGVMVIPCINKAEKLQGFRFEFDKYNLKGSEVHRNMSLGNIVKQIEKNNVRFKEVGKQVAAKMIGKGLDAAGNLPLKITKEVVKTIIKKGLDLGM